MNYYVIFNNSFSGIIKSQVVDRIKFIEKEANSSFILVVFLPLKGIRIGRRAYSENGIRTVVIPMIGGLRFWTLGFLFLLPLAMLNRPKKVIGRAIFATKLGLWLKSIGLCDEVIYDGRGAVAAEWREYLGKTGWPIPYRRIQSIERDAVLMSDIRIAVSNELVNYWETEYGFVRDLKFEVVPCTANQMFTERAPDVEARIELRQNLGVLEDDVLLLHSGSKSDWQGVESLMKLLAPILKSDEKVKLLLLSNQSIPAKSKDEFGDRLIQDWVKPEEVWNYYNAADYGILLRDNSVTNQVASPVKFAEYLASGLNVLISKRIGDYSEFVIEASVGYCLDDNYRDLILKPTPLEEKLSIRAIGLQNFANSSHEFALLEVLK
jgi:glycosyltransferase involved in cell wall biosynthesis